MKHVKMCGLLVAMLALAGPARATTVIDFEDWTGGGAYPLISGGYKFAGGSSLFIGPQPGTDNLTNSLHSYEGGIKMTPSTDEPYSLLSLDFNEGFGPSGTVAVRLVGSLGFGNAIEETFVLDGLAETWETFAPVGFLNVVGNIHFYAEAAEGGTTPLLLSVDNIVIPEPSALSLLLVIVLAIWRRRKLA